jgi:hypothetical protein
MSFTRRLVQAVAEIGVISAAMGSIVYEYNSIAYKRNLDAINNFSQEIANPRMSITVGSKEWQDAITDVSRDLTSLGDGLVKIAVRVRSEQWHRRELDAQDLWRHRSLLGRVMRLPPAINFEE